MRPIQAFFSRCTGPEIDPSRSISGAQCNVCGQCAARPAGSQSARRDD